METDDYGNDNFKINEKTKEGKTLMDLIKLFSVKNTNVEIINENQPFIEDSIQDFKKRKNHSSKKCKRTT